MANLDRFGTVDEDRLAGIRTKLGPAPTLVPIKTTIHNLDTGASPTGTTQVAEPDYLALSTAYGIWANDDATSTGSGRAWRRRAGRSPAPRAGSRPHGEPGQRWSSLDNATGDPAIEAANAVDALT